MQSELKPEVAVRLECLKLAHTHGREIPQVVERAKAYEAYVQGTPESAAKTPAGRPVIGLPKSGT